ncbi:DUF413 domain-containing protein [Aliivibrio logei]|uniref:Macrodomain Ori protein n=1 Tax=Aliivibrio logei 5S-186 TaxID=626086 RepID=A0ABX3AS62_ALILO|nr:DUF413 domain-containing protein [Aliivibrio logei]OEF11043.1 hypothetical protein A1Q5_11405 [Aliivibrio logei 5S-186]
MRKNIRFYDDLHFPKGFNRKGFTVKEAEVLNYHGVTMKGLLNGSLIPNSSIEKQFIDDVKGGNKEASLFVKCWLKYIDLSTTKTKLHTLCGNPYEN